MGCYQHIIVGTNGSESAQTAVAVAGEFAVRLGIPVTAVSVWKDAGRKSGTDAEWAEDNTRTAAEALLEAGVAEVVGIELDGAAGALLLEIAEREPGTLLVIGGGSLGSSKARLLGSTANHVSHHSQTDVVFTSKVPKRWTTVGLTTDGSASSLTAVRRGYDLALALGARPFLVTSAKVDQDGVDTLIDVEAQLAVEDPELFGRDVLTGVPAAEAICNSAWKYDLVVIGNRGMSGPARLLGSVANKVTHDIDTNLLLVNTTH
ncbi:universal stress protein [Nocardia salmonicida]|uniref:universal stress protein n=1 Tax=Nocardia salmonicida TaxID=53431 RepID=UPI002E2E1085|nr:universal stress protein [Nocardia salmonicida]